MHTSKCSDALALSVCSLFAPWNALNPINKNKTATPKNTCLAGIKFRLKSVLKELGNGNSKKLTIAISTDTTPTTIVHSMIIKLFDYF